MITGRSYDWALARLPLVKEKGVRNSDLMFQLWRSGFFVKMRYHVKQIRRLKNVSILIVREPGETIGHAVVWDPSNQSILDPALKKHHQHSIWWYEKHLRIVVEIKK